MNKFDDNSFLILKNNLEIVNLIKFIDESPLNDEFKIKIKDYLFSIDYKNDYNFNDNILNSNLQFNNLIDVIKETVSHFNILSEDIDIFENEINYSINHFYDNIYMPTIPVLNETTKVDKISESEGIYYLHDYVPDSTPREFLHKFSQEKQDTSAEIWRKYKKNNVEAIIRFTKELMCAISWISNNKIDENIERICLVSVPSSTPLRDSDSPIRKSIEIIENWYESGIATFEYGCTKDIINGGFLLYRFEEVKRSHKVRSIERPKCEDHMQTIKVDDNNPVLSLDNTAFFIIDDISTTGGILRACYKKLHNNGVDENRIIKLVIGKTVWWSR